MELSEYDGAGLEHTGPMCWCGGCADEPCSISAHEARAYAYGAAAAFGLTGMAQAIRDRVRYGERQEFLRQLALELQRTAPAVGDSE